MNIPIILGAALIPTIIGFIWYNPNFGFGKAWMSASGVTDEMAKTGNMAVIIGVSLVLSVLLSAELTLMSVHQFRVVSLFLGHETAETNAFVENFMATYGHLHRTFSHGAIHGLIAGLCFVLPVLGTNALFERKGFKYIAINVGYWTVTLALMGGVLCQFA